MEKIEERCKPFTLIVNTYIDIKYKDKTEQNIKI